MVKHSDLLHVPVNVLRHAHDTEAQKYKTFNETQESWITFRILALLFTIYYVGSMIVRIRYLIVEDLSSAPVIYKLCETYIAFETALILLVWFLVWLKRNDNGNTLNVRKVAVVNYATDTPLTMYLQNAVILLITCLLGSWLLIRVSQGKCEDRLSVFNFTCNPYDESYGLPIDSVIGLMLIPLTFCVVLRGTSFWVHIATWLLTLGFLLATSVFTRIDQNLPFFLIYAPTSLILLYESERQNKVIFLVTEKLSFLLEENERLADETHANELRHMVGNVAHDLRTPLTSFLSCMDMMGNTLDSFFMKSSKSLLDVVEIQQNIGSLNELLGSLKNATTFMSMAINRCLDFTRASKGMALIPNPETINIHHALDLPMRVVTDMQSRIGLNVGPIPPEVCSHLLTDLHWLQENLLCLVSNGVKYSTVGEVHIDVSLHGLAELKRHDGPELDAGVFTSSRITVHSKTQALPPPQSHYTSSAKLDIEDGGPQLSKLDDVRSETTEQLNEKSVHIAFTDVVIVRIPGGVIFISKNINIGRNGQVFDEKSKRKFLRFEVTDSGIGMDEATMLTIFNPFRQAQRMNGGVGLGLYSMAKRCEAIGGYYGVSKRPDGFSGCRFFFGIPYIPDELSSALRKKPVPSMKNILSREKILADGPEESMKKTFSAENLITPKGDPSTPLHILVVDDSIPIVKMSSMILRRHGHIVETAQHGAEALDKIELARLKHANVYDLVLMDLQMPVMDGIEAIKRIRAGERERAIAGESDDCTLGELGANDSFIKAFRQQADHLKVIAMSANGDPAARESALSAGADNFMCKPFSLGTLHQMLEQLEA